MKLDNISMWEEIFNCFKEIKYYPSPAYKSILYYPTGSITNIQEIPDGQNVIFQDLENSTYFYGFSPENLKELLTRRDKIRVLGLYTGQCQNDNEIIKNSCGLIYRERNEKTPLGEKLEQLIKEGKKVTHIVRTKDVYGGNTHYSVWRSHDKAEIYGVER